MINIHGSFYVQDDLLDVMYKLRDSVYKAKGKYYFSSIKRVGDSVMISCPFHKGGQEKNPSCGGSTITGVFHCFACGMVSSIVDVINFVFEEYTDDKFGEKWLKANCSVSYAQVLDISDLDIPEYGKKKDLCSEVYYGFNTIPQSVLQSYRVIHPYMKKRGLNEEVIAQFDIGFDPFFRLIPNPSPQYDIPSITFPVKNPYDNGNVIYVLRRSIEGKLFSIPKEVEKKPLYGLYEFYRDTKAGVRDEKITLAKEVVITESCFNALTCWVNGIPGMALLGTGAVHQYPMLERLPVNTMYLGLDPDDAGRNGTYKILCKLHRNNLYVLDIPEGKDINDLSNNEFNNLEALTPGEWGKKYKFDVPLL